MVEDSKEAPKISTVPQNIQNLNNLYKVITII
jgi:hypothetical protein